MSKDNNASSDSKASVTITVDVTKIVKYVCCAGVFVVGIIFGTKCYHKMLEEGFFKI